jgi:hypothetical protein
MSLWLSAADSGASAARGFWMAELHRGQTAIIQGMTEQMIRLWSGAWMIRPKAKALQQRRPQRRRTVDDNRRAKR